MDFVYVFKSVADLFSKICMVRICFAGMEFPAWVIYVWVGLAGLLIWFLKGLCR